MRASEFKIAAAVATATPKDPGHNQDRALACAAPPGGAGAVAFVCDGVGSFDGSGDVAADCVRVVAAYVAEQGIDAGVLNCAEAAAEALVGAEDGATTLLAIGAEPDGHAYYTFVGNGAIVEIEPVDIRGGRGNLRVAELVLPHVSYAEGRPALRSFFPAPTRPVEESSGVLLPRPGRTRVLLACSDGISTDEDCAVGTTSDGQTWKQIRRPLADLLDTLAVGWLELLAAPDAEQALTELLQGALDGLLASGAFDDDATVAAVLIRPVPDTLE